MHIGFDAKRFFHNDTGLGAYSRDLIQALAEKDLKISLFDAQPTETKWLEQYSNVQVISPLKKQSFWRQYGIAKDIEDSGIDVFHGLSAELPLVRLKIPTVVTIHDIIYEIFPRQYTRADRMIYRQKTKWATKHAHRIVSISSRTARDLVKKYGVDEKKIEVIPPYTESGSYQVVRAQNDYILCLSQFEQRKNHMALVRAYKRAREKKRLPELILAGKSGKTLKEVQDYVAHHKLQNCIRIKVNITEEEKSELLTNAMYTVFPSLYEGYGIPVVEAMNKGKISVVAKDTSMEEIIGDAGLFFDPMNPRSLDRTLLSISEEMLTEKEAKIQESLARASKERVTNLHLDLYKNILNL